MQYTESISFRVKTSTKLLLIVLYFTIIPLWLLIKLFSGCKQIEVNLTFEDKSKGGQVIYNENNNNNKTINQ